MLSCNAMSGASDRIRCFISGLVMGVATSPAVEIAVHPVCAGRKHQVCTLRVEVVHPGVLKNRPRMLRTVMFSLKPGIRAASNSSTHHQVDLNTRLTGFMQCADDFEFTECVELGRIRGPTSILAACTSASMRESSVGLSVAG